MASTFVHVLETLLEEFMSQRFISKDNETNFVPQSGLQVLFAGK